ncbi:hypothetical protein Zm00014a_032596 [Zea mays]|uniref:Uncharacterized protein n=1 Tax=Zea mays TaxID=4577 RepID=A0A3L6E9J1_MAIZE|nr:hypothetical protein Zm00014a_032596 [Zea mays]
MGNCSSAVDAFLQRRAFLQRGNRASPSPRMGSASPSKDQHWHHIWLPSRSSILRQSPPGCPAHPQPKEAAAHEGGGGDTGGVGEEEQGQEQQ